MLLYFKHSACQREHCVDVVQSQLIYRVSQLHFKAEEILSQLHFQKGLVVK